MLKYQGFLQRKSKKFRLSRYLLYSHSVINELSEFKKSEKRGTIHKLYRKFNHKSNSCQVLSKSGGLDSKELRCLGPMKTGVTVTQKGSNHVVLRNRLQQHLQVLFEVHEGPVPHYFTKLQLNL